MSPIAPPEMDFSQETFAAFSDALAALYAAPDRARRSAALLAELRPVFVACAITIDAVSPSAPVDSDVSASADGGELTVPIDGTAQQLTLRRDGGFSEHERFLVAQLRAHLAAAFGVRRPPAAPRAAVPADPIHLRALGLTARECEVLHWIMRGKRDAEIAGIVGAAPRTVNKHVENILHKLAVETRLGAARTAADWLAQKGRDA